MLSPITTIDCLWAGWWVVVLGRWEGGFSVSGWGRSLMAVMLRIAMFTLTHTHTPNTHTLSHSLSHALQSLFSRQPGHCLLSSTCSRMFMPHVICETPSSCFCSALFPPSQLSSGWCAIACVQTTAAGGRGQTSVSPAATSDGDEPASSPAASMTGKQQVGEWILQ